MAKLNSVSDFWGKVDKTKGPCWIWTRARDEDGYGIFHYQRKPIRAVRFLMGVVLGHDIDGLIVRHSCDNPPCVNPEHLLIGTHKDNCDDREARGRGVKGRKQSLSHVSKRIASKMKNWKGHAIETKLKLAKAQMGKKASAETRAKMSAMRQGVPRPDLIGMLAGEKNGNSKLTEPTVLQIRHGFDRGETKASLARRFGIGETHVTRIVTRRAWKNI